MALPQFQNDDRNFQMMQNSWAAQLNPLLANPLSNGLLLKGVSLANGTTVINHKLGRTLQGWMITDITGAANIYRSQPKNALTLTLVSDAAVEVDIYAF